MGRTWRIEYECVLYHLWMNPVHLNDYDKSFDFLFFLGYPVRPTWLTKKDGGNERPDSERIENGK